MTNEPTVQVPVSLPTREQIAEAKKREFAKWADQDSAYERAVASSWFDAGVYAVLALLQKGAADD